MAEDMKLFVWGERQGDVFTELKAVAVASDVEEARRYIRADKEMTEFAVMDYLDEPPEVYEGAVALVTDEEPAIYPAGLKVIYHDGEGTPHTELYLEAMEIEAEQ